MSLDTLKSLEKRLYECAKNAFIKIVQEFAEDNIYSLALYTSGDYGYLTTSCSTNTGLRIAAEKYSAEKYFAGYSIQQIEEELKWIPCDSPHHLAFGKEMLVDDLMNELSQESFRLYMQDKFEESDSVRRDTEQVLVRVLQSLDREGIFGCGNLREGMVINILKGDQSDEERLKFAKLLNSSNVFNRFRKELIV